MRNSSLPRLDPDDLKIIYNQNKFELFGRDLCDNIEEETLLCLEEFVDALNSASKNHRFKVKWHIIFLLILCCVSFIIIIALHLPFYFLSISVIILVIFCLEVARLALKGSNLKKKIIIVVEEFKGKLRRFYTIEDNFTMRGRKYRYRGRKRGIYLRKNDILLLNLSIKHDVSHLKSEYQDTAKNLIIPMYSINPTASIQVYQTPRKTIECQ